MFFRLVNSNQQYLGIIAHPVSLFRDPLERLNSAFLRATEPGNACEDYCGQRQLPHNKVVDSNG